MTKHILFSLFSLLFICVSISNALESQDSGLVSNDQVPREADTVHAVLSNSLSEEIASSRLARAAASDAVKRKNKERRRRRKKSSKKTGKKKNNTKAGTKRNKSKKKVGKKRKNSKKEKAKKKKIKSSKRKNNKKKMKAKKNRQDGNTITIVCPECPSEKTLVCKDRSKERRGQKLTRKEKKRLRKTMKIDKKIARINKKYRKSRNGGNTDEDDDKLCTPCCPDIPTETPPPGVDPTTTTAQPLTTLPPNNCTECVMQTATVMDVWRFQVTNFEKQKKRVEKQNQVATNKASDEKTSNFTSLADHLMGLSCAMNMAEIDEIKMKLMECPAKVKAACNLTKVDQTNVDECTTKTTDFVAAATICKNQARKGKSDDCPCFKSLYDNLADVKSCKIPETSTIAGEFQACKAAFSECKKLEDSVGPAVIKGMCGTSTTTGAPRLRRKWMFDKLRV